MNTLVERGEQPAGRKISVQVDLDSLGDVPFSTFEPLFRANLERRFPATEINIECGLGEIIHYSEDTVVPNDQIVHECSEVAFKKALNQIVWDDNAQAAYDAGMADERAVKNHPDAPVWRRKIIQIAACAGSSFEPGAGISYQSELFALCNDGTLWILDGSWMECKSIPQSKQPKETES